ncbi:hypothetical protein GCM10010449_84310 [Streptomyces rectiviolaceus]|uniref:Methyltransferase type 11 domain-containing protein n=1 Tax=Streptomyces rectiviolaceus TaxID=332591 RepID=A0ABP6NNL1_9ACTN
MTGYDFSPEALRQAANAGMRDRLSYARWDIDVESIPDDLRPSGIDVVTCRFALPYLDRARLLTDVGRWLADSGTFYALVRVDVQGADTRPAPGPDEAAGAEAFRRGLTEEQIQSLGHGWAHRETYSLSRWHRAIMLRGYGG